MIRSFVIYPFFMFLTLYPALLRGQENLTAGEWKERGQQALEIGDLYTAIDHFENAFHKASAGSKKQLKYRMANRLGELYREARDYTGAREYYRLLYQKNSGEYPKAKFYYALMVKRNGSYGKAAKLFEEIKKDYRGRDRRAIRERATEEWKGCRMAREKENQKDWELRHLEELNHAYTDFSPLLINDSTMMYASVAADSQIVLPVGKNLNSRYHARLYRADLKNGTWKPAGSYPGPFNKNNYETGNGAFSPGGDHFYFNRCRLNNQNKMICAIYRSEKNDDGEWSKPERLNEQINLPGYTSTQPTVGYESRNNYEVVYFSSDRPGSRGGMDIWYTVFDPRRKTWRKPRNLGRDVNTKWDEMTPWYDQENSRLYFSSNGRPGYGGLDVFHIQGELYRWQGKPENTGPPVNTSADELYFNISRRYGKGFVVSNHKGGIALQHATCCDDIYQVSLQPEKLLHVRGKVQVHEEKNRKPLKGAKVNLVKVTKIGGKWVADSTRTDQQGSFRVKAGDKGAYFLHIKKKGYLSYSTKTFRAEDIARGMKIPEKPVVLKKITSEPVVIRNIYYKFDKHELTQESKEILDTTILKIMKDNPEIMVEISSHTDGRGPFDYNMELSQKRAQSVVGYLVSYGIDPDRLKAKGYGETKPIAPNFNMDGSDNPEGRRKNRRTEFRVTGKMENARFIYRE